MPISDEDHGVRHGPFPVADLKDLFAALCGWTMESEACIDAVVPRAHLDPYRASVLYHLGKPAAVLPVPGRPESARLFLLS